MIGYVSLLSLSISFSLGQRGTHREQAKEAEQTEGADGRTVGVADEAEARDDDYEIKGVKRSVLLVDEVSLGVVPVGDDLQDALGGEDDRRHDRRHRDELSDALGGVGVLQIDARRNPHQKNI